MDKGLPEQSSAPIEFYDPTKQYVHERNCHAEKILVLIQILSCSFLDFHPKKVLLFQRHAWMRRHQKMGFFPGAYRFMFFHNVLSLISFLRSERFS